MRPLGPFGAAPPSLAVGVSGGPHSLALVLLAEAWARARRGSCLALVADHGLRAGSGVEAIGVAATLVARGIAAWVLPLGLTPGSALHERAREARFAALLRACGESGAAWLLLGHHAADAAETALFRLLRGSGVPGLARMPGARPAPEALVLRPLLPLPPARLEATAAAAGLVPLRDPSNSDPRHARGQLRAALDDANGTGPAVAALDAAARAWSARAERLASAVAARLAEAVVFRPEGWAVLDPAALGTDEIARGALSRLLRAVSGAAYPPPRAGVAAMLARGGGTLGGALWRVRFVCREPSACAPPVIARPGVTWDGRWRVEDAPPGATLGALGATGAAALPRETQRDLPAAVLSGLPALRRRGALLGVPPLGSGEGRLSLLPSAGPLLV